MVQRARQKAEYGDFQTPPALAHAVCARIGDIVHQPAALLEPTCGCGNFLAAGLDRFKTITQAVGVDISAERIAQAARLLSQRQDGRTATLIQADFFSVDWKGVISGLPEPILVLGNPPWVTNSGLGVLQSKNLPAKANFQGHGGLDAITGKANFDISEWMLIRLLEAIGGRQATLAMLCKSSTARRTLSYAWKNAMPIELSAVYGIDANLHFDAAVDAVLLVIRSGRSTPKREASVYESLAAQGERSTIGYEDDMLLADIGAYHQWKHLRGSGILRWRSGIKHDCARVMELCREGGRYRNGLGQVVDVEETCLYPMLKSSALANGDRGTTNRFMVVTQKAVGEPTVNMERVAPRTWAYLTEHIDSFNRRASSIYRNRPAFSIFGVGDYAFAPWKVAISGLYKKLAFVPVGPIGNKPVVLDDTSYFFPCETRKQAVLLTAMLNSPTARSFYSAFLFWDSKRPVTAEILRRLDFRRLANELDLAEEFAALFGRGENEEDNRERKCGRLGRKQLRLWAT
jgi:hypothetical protein